jgi:hypothetical protein
VSTTWVILTVLAPGLERPHAGVWDFREEGLFCIAKALAEPVAHKAHRDYLVNGGVDWAISRIFRPLLAGIGGYVVAFRSAKAACISRYFREAKGDIGGCVVQQNSIFPQNFFWNVFSRPRWGGWAHIFHAEEGAVMDYSAHIYTCPLYQAGEGLQWDFWPPSKNFGRIGKEGK